MQKLRDSSNSTAKNSRSTQFIRKDNKNPKVIDEVSKYKQLKKDESDLEDEI